MALPKDSKHENELLNAAIHGDVASLTYLVNTYKDLAYTIARGIVPNNEDAEEVVQDAFMKAFAALNTFKKASKFSTWLYRIVYNTAVTKLNSRKLPTRDIEAHIETGQSTVIENDGWDLITQAERKKYVNLAINKLSKDERIVIMLYYIGEKSIGEICEILGAGKSAVKMRLSRGRAQLEIELKLLLNDDTKNLL